MTREPIYSALYSRLSSGGLFATVSRRLVHWTDVPRAQCPAVYVTQRSEIAQVQRGQPIRWLLNVDLYIYAYAESTDDQSPSVIMNPLLDAVCGMFNPDPITGTAILGGKAYHCRVSGTIETDEGVLGELAVAIVPLIIEVPD